MFVSRRPRGHIELGIVYWIMAILVLIAADAYYRHVTGRGSLSLWDGRSVIRFDGRDFELAPGPLEVKRWSTGGAFGQPSRQYMSLSRGGEVIYEGPAPEAERLQRAFEQAGGPPVT